MAGGLTVGQFGEFAEKKVLADTLTIIPISTGNSLRE
jgi:hypothetical protein